MLYDKIAAREDNQEQESKVQEVVVFGVLPSYPQVGAEADKKCRYRQVYLADIAYGKGAYNP